jgi:hypothetical protein
LFLSPSFGLENPKQETINTGIAAKRINLYFILRKSVAFVTFIFP